MTLLVSGLNKSRYDNYLPLNKDEELVGLRNEFFDRIVFCTKMIQTNEQLYKDGIITEPGKKRIVEKCEKEITSYRELMKLVNEYLRKREN